MLPSTIGLNYLHRAVAIKLAGIDDIAAVRQLAAASQQECSSGEHPTAQNSMLVPEASDARAIDALRDQTILICRLENRLVAAAGWRLTCDRSRAARLSLLTVDPLFRRLGLGRLLSSRLEENAQRAGHNAMVVVAAEANADFFERIGYQTMAYSVRRIGSSPRIRMRHLRKPLTGQPPDLDFSSITLPKLAAGHGLRADPAAGHHAIGPIYSAQELGLVDVPHRPMLSKASH